MDLQVQDRNILQQEFVKLQLFSRDQGMSINKDKSKVMLFNPGKKHDFLPKIETDDGSILDVVEEAKLLGILVRSDMSWKSNTNLLCNKGYSRLWMLRNLARLGTDRTDLVDVYHKQCRSVLELAVPAWTPGLTRTEINQLERVQKTACAIILGDEYKSYRSALTILKMETLEKRRVSLSLNFAKKALKDDKFKKWFCMEEKSEPNIKTRNSKSKQRLKPVTCRKIRYEKSPLPFLTELLNKEAK